MDTDFPPLAWRTLQLDGGVTVALLHEPQARRVALAASVAAGSCHEPPAWPGLAHFLEHALFLGSAGHPQVGAFADYVHGHGGRYNARTLDRQTLYYLELPERELAPGLGRLVDLLARPLLLEERLAAEREVLEAEYRARCADGDCQLQGALAGLLHPGHPLARFHAGNRATLDTDDPRLHAALRAWHARHYRGASLRLLLSGPQPLDELERLARELGAALPGGAPAPAEHWPPLWPAGQGLVELRLAQPQRRQCMSLWLPLSVAPAREDALLALLRQAASQPAAGGLLAALRGRDWAQAVHLDWLSAGDGTGLLGVRLDLLAGAAGCEIQIAALCHDWLLRLGSAPTLAAPAAEWRALCRERAWQEAELAPLERAALWLERWPRQGGDWQPWPAPQAPAALLAGLAVEPRRLIVQVAEAQLDGGELSPWFPVRRQVRPLPGLPAVALPGWQAPPANPFLAAVPACAPEPEPEPALLRPGHAALALAWQAPGTVDARRRLAVELAEAALAGRWLQALHGAASLGHDWQALSGPGQLRFCLSGPAASLMAVLERLLDGLAEDDPAHWRAAVQHRRDEAQQQLLLRRLLSHPAAQWRLTEAELALPRLDALDDAALRQALHDVLGASRRHVRVFGALPERPAGFAPDSPQPAPGARWQGGEHCQHLDLGEREQAVLLRLLAPPGDAEREAAWRLLAVLQQGAFYQALRVEQGLGYALFSRFHAGEQGAELQFGVQSPHAAGERLQLAVRAFVEQTGAALASLTDERLRQARAAALEALEGGSRRARLLRACCDWLAGQDAGQQNAVREALQRLDGACLQRAAAGLQAAEWRWLFSQ